MTVNRFMMRALAPISAVCLLLLSASQLMAEPANVMVEGLTFVRPPEWKWRAPVAESNIAAVFDAFDENNEKMAEVLFYTSEKSIEEVKEMWKAAFTSSGDQHTLQENETQTETRRVVYINLQGTFEQKQKKDKSKKPNHTLVGAIIRKGNQTLIIRAIGPTSQIKKISTTFQKMVEEAVKAEEAGA